MTIIRFFITVFLIAGISSSSLLIGQTRDQLWLLYYPVENEALKSQYREMLATIKQPVSSPTVNLALSELKRGLTKMIGITPQSTDGIKGAKLVLEKLEDLDPKLKSTIGEGNELGLEGYQIKTVQNGELLTIVLTSKEEIGLLYGVFHLLKLVQTNQPLEKLDIISTPKTQVRLLNHWDNLDRTSERGYAGFSIWDWHKLPDYIDPRYLDYARANASIGINGTVLTNVNSNALILTPTYLEKVKALADTFRPYGIKVYLTARFSAPIEIGGLKTADPLDPQIQEWWNDKVKEIYEYIPDFGGFLVKANSEGQPGPQNYNRTHAEGANLLARSLKPYGGIVMWRAFVYSNEEPEDRAKQAYNEFLPLDGKFDENVLVQIKNGPIDFQPREPFHPLFGAMKQTPSMMEFQITQEYLGQATQLVYLGPMYEEVLQSDTYCKGSGSTVSKVIQGELYPYKYTGMAGVANIGTDENWTGHPIAQPNWYVFGRMAWDPDLTAQSIADEWVRRTYGNDSDVVSSLTEIMMSSHQAAVNYMTPLGLAHLMGTGHHYGPAPWVNNLPRGDWNPVYYHRADSLGIGFDRTTNGSDAVSQYFKPVADLYNDPGTCPENLLLWFHHIPWNYTMSSGRTLWDELNFRYQDGINTVRSMQESWNQLEGKIDEERFNSVRMLLEIQVKEAIWWKDACLLYFQTFSEQPFPDFLEKPTHTLEYYQSLQFPFAPGHH